MRQHRFTYASALVISGLAFQLAFSPTAEAAIYKASRNSTIMVSSETQACMSEALIYWTDGSGYQNHQLNNHTQFSGTSGTLTCNFTFYWGDGSGPQSFTANISYELLGTGDILDKERGQNCNNRGNPCNAATGNKFETETDYQSGDGLLFFTRSYNSQSGRDMGLGIGWTANGLHRLDLQTSAIRRVGPDDRTETFTYDGSQWQADTDSNIIVTLLPGGEYHLEFKTGGSEEYDVSGNLLRNTDSTGRTTTYTYSQGRLSTITGPFGHTLALGYNSDQLVTLTDPANRIISYQYDSNKNLKQVNYPDGTSRVFHYEDVTFKHLLTGITNDNARFSTFAYDASGRAIRTEHAQTDNGAPQEKFSFNYDSDTQTTVTDAIGTREVMTFATNLGVKNLTDKVNQLDGKSVQQIFDAKNNLTCKKDEENRVTLYGYNSTNQRTSMTEGLLGNCTSPQNTTATRLTSYTYLSPTLDLPTVIESPSVAGGAYRKRTTLSYGDSRFPALPTAITQSGYTPTGAAVSRSVTLGYNASGQVNSINGPRTDVNDVTTLEYYECTTGGGCGQLRRVTNALGHITTYDLYDANGRLRQMTDPNGLVTAYSYDPRGRVKTVSRSGGGISALWQYSYTPWGDISQAIDPDGVVLNYQYDAAHDLRFIVDAAGNYIHYKYDLKGNRTGEDVYDAGGYLRRALGYAYDLRNRPSQIDLAGDITQIAHDAVGNLTSETDPNNHGTTHQYDALNRLFQTVNALSQETSYGLDTNDRPTVVTAPNGPSTQYQHDDFGNLLKEISPDRRTTDFTYDATGNVLTVKDARNITTTYTYDALNRVTVQQSSDANTPRYNYYYDACFRGQLCNISLNGAGHQILNYDKLGRLSYQLDLSTLLYSSYAYTSGGRLSQITYPSDRIVNYQYDALGRVNQIGTTLDDSTTVLAQNFAYYPFGPVNGFSFGNGQYFFMNVDQAYRPTFQRSGPRFKTAFYDPAGNLNALDDINGTAQTFTYSTLNELTSASDTQTGNYGNLGYTYLLNGNRETETRNGVISTYTYANNRNRLTDTGNLYWLYDAAGNATWSNYAYVMGYDGYGRMTSALSGSAIYAYNPLNQRTRKTAEGITTRFHYGPSGELLFETGGGGNKAYVYLNGMPLARVDSNSQIYYYHTDQLGTPQAMTNSSGAVVWKALYEPFGKAIITIGTIMNNLRLAGQYFDAETGLHYNWHRYYDPKIGGYITAEPLGVVPGVASSAAVPREITEYFRSIPLNERLLNGLNHPYRYAYNNPLRYIDPTGLSAYGWFGLNPGHVSWLPPQSPAAPLGPFGPLCGPADNPRLATWIPDIYPEACQTHDKCYEDCPKTKGQCDEEFRRKTGGLSGPLYDYSATQTKKSQEQFDKSRTKCECQWIQQL